MKFAVGIAQHDQLVGVAVVDRPVARHLDDTTTLEFTRSCTDGTHNANSSRTGRLRNPGPDVLDPPRADLSHVRRAGRNVKAPDSVREHLRRNRDDRLELVNETVANALNVSPSGRWSEAGGPCREAPA